MSNGNVSEKDWLFTFIICIFFGVFGFHRFYVGKKGSGYCYLFTLSFLGLGWLVDIIKLLSGTFTDKEGKLLMGLPWQKN